MPTASELTTRRADEKALAAWIVTSAPLRDAIVAVIIQGVADHTIKEEDAIKAVRHPNRLAALILSTPEPTAAIPF